jgi:methyl-accepting chemotaxis protein
MFVMAPYPTPPGIPFVSLLGDIEKIGGDIANLHNHAIGMQSWASGVHTAGTTANQQALDTAAKLSSLTDLVNAQASQIESLEVMIHVQERMIEDGRANAQHLYDTVSVLLSKVQELSRKLELTPV